MRIDRDKIELLAATRRVNGAQLAALAGMSRQNLTTIKTRGHLYGAFSCENC